MLGATRDSICSLKNAIWRLGGRRGLRAKQFMTFSVSVKHKKDNKLFLHIELTYSYQGNKTHIHKLSIVVQSSIKLQQKKTGTNIYLTFTVMVSTTELNYNWDIWSFLYMCVLCPSTSVLIIPFLCTPFAFLFVFHVVWALSFFNWFSCRSFVEKIDNGGGRFFSTFFSLLSFQRNNLFQICDSSNCDETRRQCCIPWTYKRTQSWQLKNFSCTSNEV